MALIIGVVIVLLILFGFLCYKKAPPTEAIVVTGFGLARPKVVCGKGTFVLPVLQRADRLNMRLLKIDVKTPETGVKTQNGVSLWIDSVVTIQVYSENSTVLGEEVKASGLKDAKAYIMSRQQAAISNFLGMNEQGINDKVNDVLQGNLREIVSDMTVDQILTNRKHMPLAFRRAWRGNVHGYRRQIHDTASVTFSRNNNKKPHPFWMRLFFLGE